LPQDHPGRLDGDSSRIAGIRHNDRVTGIYDEPEMYELACAYRDVRGEVDALERWFVRHAPLAPEGSQGSRDGAGSSGGQGPGSVLELAAGPAEHALELARRGVSAVALDLNPAMCARARDKAQREGLELDVVHADMRDFALGRQFGLVITMLNSVCHLMNLEHLVAHLRAAAAATAPGGLYIMELAHPADILTMVPRTSSEWDTDLGGRHVHVRWGGADDAIDPVTQVTREHVLVTVRDARGSRTLTDVVPNRFWTGTEVTAAVWLAGGFTVAGCYGDFADDVSLSASSAWRMIIVLRRE
jgi:SAM-dependent methyltransferase